MVIRDDIRVAQSLEQLYFAKNVQEITVTLAHSNLFDGEVAKRRVIKYMLTQVYRTICAHTKAILFSEESMKITFSHCR